METMVYLSGLFLPATFLLWILFVNVMRLAKAVDTMPAPQKALAYIFGYFGFLYDVLYNVTIGSIMFWQLPHYKRLTLSARLQYILSTDYLPEFFRPTWRYDLAHFFCAHLIEPWDKGHCKLKDGQ